MPTLTLMASFASVVKTGSFTAAADELGISKSFVSKQVSELENELGTRLLHRSTRKLSLTDDGANFFKHCDLIVREAERACEEIIDNKNNPRGRIRITLPQSLVITNAANTLLQFQEQYPEIELDVVISGKTENLIDEGIDLAIRIGHFEDSTLVCRKLTDCVFQTVASPGYIQKHGKPTHPKDLINHNCIAYAGPNQARQWTYQLSSSETIVINTRGTFSCNDGQLVLEALLSGKGILCGPHFLFERHLINGDLELLLAEYTQPPLLMCAIYPSKQNLPQRVRLLIDYLVTNLNKTENVS